MSSGPECFNYYFPQDLDDDYLVVSDSLDGPVPWKKVKLGELQDILCTAIDDGFTFPINPKWVLVDPGWKRVYDRLINSKSSNVQESLSVWFPPGSGLQERIQSISCKYPSGCVAFSKESGSKDKEAERDLALYQLERHVVLQRAKAKLRAFRAMSSMSTTSLPSLQ